MKLNRHAQRRAVLAGAMFLFATTLAFATPEASEKAHPQVAAVATIASVAARPTTDSGLVDPGDFPSSQTGVRKAVAAGNDALRRYIWRTRTIYGYYYPAFAKEE